MEAALPSLPGGLVHLLFVRVTDVFQTMLSRVLNFQENAVVRGGEGGPAVVRGWSGGGGGS